MMLSLAESYRSLCSAPSRGPRPVVSRSHTFHRPPIRSTFFSRETLLITDSRSWTAVLSWSMKHNKKYKTEPNKKEVWNSYSVKSRQQEVPEFTQINHEITQEITALWSADSFHLSFTSPFHWLLSWARIVQMSFFTHPHTLPDAPCLDLCSHNFTTAEVCMRQGFSFLFHSISAKNQHDSGQTKQIKRLHLRVLFSFIANSSAKCKTSYKLIERFSKWLIKN